MVVGIDVAITIAVSIFLFILGLGVRFLWNISNSLIESNAKLERISDNVSQMSATLSRTNELLIRQDERLKNDMNRSDGGTNTSRQIQSQLDDYNSEIKPLNFEDATVRSSEEDGAFGTPDSSTIYLSSPEVRSREELNVLQGLISLKTREFFNQDFSDLHSSVQVSEDGFTFLIVVPTQEEETIMEYLEALEELAAIGSIEKKHPS